MFGILTFFLLKYSLNCLSIWFSFCARNKNDLFWIYKGGSRHYKEHHYEERVIFFIRHFSNWSSCTSCMSRSTLDIDSYNTKEHWLHRSHFEVEGDIYRVIWCTEVSFNWLLAVTIIPFSFLKFQTSKVSKREREKKKNGFLYYLWQVHFYIMFTIVFWN